MNNSILEAIKKKAEEIYPPKFHLNNIKVEAYTSGQVDAIEDMIKFFKILSDDFDEYTTGWECLKEARCEKWQLQYEIIYTTEELLSKYLENEEERKTSL